MKHLILTDGPIVSTQHGLKMNILMKPQKKVPLAETIGTRDSVLHIASMQGNIEEMKILLQTHRNLLESTNKFGCTPLWEACREGQIAATQLLIDNQAKINATDKTGKTPLARACVAGHAHIVSLLLQHEADVHAGDVNCFTALHHACKHNQLECIKLLIQHGADINAVDLHKRTPIHTACEFGHVATLQYLLDQTDLNVLHQDEYGWTALHRAASSNQVECIRMLLTHPRNVNMDVDMTTKLGRTALHWACMKQHTTCIQLLLEYHANIFALDTQSISCVMAVKDVQVRKQVLGTYYWIRRAAFVTVIHQLNTHVNTSSDTSNIVTQEPIASKSVGIMTNVSEEKLNMNRNNVFGNVDLCRVIAQYL